MITFLTGNRSARRGGFLFLAVFFLALTACISLQAQPSEAEIEIKKEPVVCVSACSHEGHIAQANIGEQGVVFFRSLFNTDDWPPRWQCGSWTSFHGWLYIISDIVTGICYFLIPFILWFFLYKNKQWKSFRAIIVLFILFIVACGSTHLIDAAIFWWPAYRVSALLRVLTAIVSTTTVFALIKIAPRILQLKSPEALEKLVAERTAELSDLNQRLQLEIESRKIAEKEVAKREKRFRAMIENISDGIVLNTEKSIVIYQSPSVSRILGYTFEERQGKSVITNVHEEDKEGFARLYENLALLPGQPLRFEFRFKHKQGHYIWLEGVVTNLLHDRNVNGYVANYRDISERKAAEEKLRSERQLLRTLIDNLPDYIYIKDLELRHLINNKANVKLIGAATEAETLGKTVMDYFDPVIATKFMEADKKVLKSGLPILDIEEKIVGHSNQVRWLLTSKIPLKDNDQVTGLVGISRDITERKKAELLLKDLNGSLAIQASKLAASNTELERFAYVASHDLQEPLRMVRSFLQLLKKKYETALDPEAHQYIDFAVDGSERMKQLIMDLLEYSRVGFVPEKFELVNMNEVVQNALHFLRESVRLSNASVEVGALPTVSGIKTQLGQVVQNLISNALKYQDSQSARIVISGAEEADHWRFSVTDNGIGIDSRFFDKIFIIFQRLNTQSDRRGTGLGLAICKKIVEGQGGKIWVESQVGVGSTFHFTVSKRAHN
jgi:two-component system CheB/CheR fusion protein